MTDRGNDAQGSSRGIEDGEVAAQRRTVQPTTSDVEDSRVSSTHDVHGGGNPRLIVTFEDGSDLRERLGESGQSTEFALLPGVTTFGSDPNSTIVLPLVAAHQAEVRRDDMDEYSLFDTSPDQSSSVDGRQGTEQILHTGNRVALGPWTLIYAREEYADHGSPYGGHEGGWPNGIRESQPAPRPRGTSPSGGSEATAEDAGEYY